MLVKVLLKVEYPESYPDELPKLSLLALEGNLEDDEMDLLIEELETIGIENLGIAMTFTLISRLRERLSELLQTRAARLEQAALEKERLELEVLFLCFYRPTSSKKIPKKAEEARTRGTPVTKESFLAWKTKFDKEMTLRRVAGQEERLKALPSKEREETRKISGRPTGNILL